MNLYTIRDKKADAVAAPFAAPNDGVACRYVMESLRDPQSMLAKYPKDYEVLFVGEYNESTGELGPAPARLIVEVTVLADTLKG